MQAKLKVLILIKPFFKNFSKHKPKFETIRAIENFAEVKYWYKNGDIRNIIKILNFTPDFIFHYDIANSYALAPVISGLNKVDIPKGCFVIDTDFSPVKRRKYFEDNKIDLIFSVTKSQFLKTHPTYKEKFRWLPFSINPRVFTDWQLDKDIDFLLIGQVYDRVNKTGYPTGTRKGKYPFRDEVLDRMRGEKGFVFHPHPGHSAPEGSIINEKYAQELNRAKIFFTCGSFLKYPVLKYFEAPACKTLLLAESIPDILDLGFKDGVNFVACDQSNFYEKAMYYLENEDERIKIAENGYEFIHANHTDDVRAKKFINMIQDFIQNK